MTNRYSWDPPDGMQFLAIITCTSSRRIGAIGMQSPPTLYAFGFGDSVRLVGMEFHTSVRWGLPERIHEPHPPNVDLNVQITCPIHTYLGHEVESRLLYDVLKQLPRPTGGRPRRIPVASIQIPDRSARR